MSANKTSSNDSTPKDAIPKENASRISQAKALLNLHSWSGIVLGILLYAVIFTGTVAVVADEIGDWANSNQRQAMLLNADIDSILATLSAHTDPIYTEEIGISEGHQGELVFFFHTHEVNPRTGQMDDLGVQYRTDIDGNILKQFEGFASDLFQEDHPNALSRFLVAIHTELHIPSPWGLILTGILGFAMLIAAVSGYKMHKHLFTDLFIIRKQRDKTPLVRDAHTVAGTWSIPFALLLAFTGAFFSFAGAFGLPAMAMVAFGGDQEAMIYTLVGEQKEKDESPLDSASVNAMLRDAQTRESGVPNFVSVSHPDTKAAQMTLFYSPSDGGVEPKQVVYDMTTGEFSKYKPQVGTVPSLGSTILALIFPIHFGTFAGLLSKLVWISLGVASCYVTITGLKLYAVRKEKSARRWLTRLNHWGFLGLPICSLAAGLGFFSALLAGASTSSWTPLFFVGAAAVITLFCLANPKVEHIKITLLWCNALLCLTLPILRMTITDVGLFTVLANNMEAVLLIDSMLWVCAIACFIYIAKHQWGMDVTKWFTKTKQEKEQNA